jgi:hypothetical protein
MRAHAPGGRQLLGLALFLFIPVVLFLFVVHPRPLAASLVVGVVLMLGHRRLARPYMERVRQSKCLWCNRTLAPGAGEVLRLATGGGLLEARCCAAHRAPAARFFTFVAAARWPLRLGIFVPLLVLLATLAAAAAGRPVPLEEITMLFKLVIGVMVNVASLGYLALRRSPPPEAAPAVPFPAHNFFLLGVRNLLWVFRLVGVWWIVQALRYLFFTP